MRIDILQCHIVEGAGTRGGQLPQHFLGAFPFVVE
jgi:hypothetical protein